MHRAIARTFWPANPKLTTATKTAPQRGADPIPWRTGGIPARKGSLMANVALVAVPVLLAVLVLGSLAVWLRQDRGTPAQPLRAVTGRDGRLLVLYAAAV